MRYARHEPDNVHDQPVSNNIDNPGRQMNLTENFRDKYTKSGRIGGWLINRFYGVINEFVRKCATETKTVLEIGVGEGFSTQRIRQMLPRDVRLEASEFHVDLVRLAQQRNPDIHVSQESIYALNRQPSSFDLVLCLEVLEHLENPQAGLAELARVCRKFCIVSVPREPVWRLLNMMRGKYLRELGNTPGHLQHWSADGFREFVAPTFDVMEVRTPLPWTILLMRKKI